MNFEILLDNSSLKLIDAIRKIKTLYNKIVSKSFMAKEAAIEVSQEVEKGIMYGWILKLLHLYIMLFVIVDFIFIYPCWKIIHYLEVRNPKV